MKTNGSNQTKMAAALEKARKECTQAGGNPGRVGHRILTNNAKNGWSNGSPATRPHRNESTAVSAEKVIGVQK